MNGYNFSEGTRKVLALARGEANRLGHEYVGTEHLLLALLREREGVAAAALRTLAVDPNELCLMIEQTVTGGRPQAETNRDLPYTSRAKKVLELSMSEARELRHGYVGTEHLLLGLIREERGIAAQVLAHAGLRLHLVRAEIVRLLATEEAPVADTSPPRHAWATDDASGHTAILGPALGRLYHTLRNELGWLYVKWDQFQALYGGSAERLELLNDTAPLLFRIVQDALWDDIGRHLRTLSAEPGATGGLKSGVRDLPDLIDDESLRADIRRLLAKVVQDTQWVHDAPARGQVGADLALALERRARRLDHPSRMMVQDALESVAAVLNHLDWHYRQPVTTFDAGGFPHGALALLYSLRQARTVRDSGRERTEGGEQASGPRESPPH